MDALILKKAVLSLFSPSQESESKKQWSLRAEQTAVSELMSVHIPPCLSLTAARGFPGAFHTRRPTPLSGVLVCFNDAKGGICANDIASFKYRVVTLLLHTIVDGDESFPLEEAIAILLCSLSRWICSPWRSFKCFKPNSYTLWMSPTALKRVAQQDRPRSVRC